MKLRHERFLVCTIYIRHCLCSQLNNGRKAFPLTSCFFVRRRRSFRRLTACARESTRLSRLRRTYVTREVKLWQRGSIKRRINRDSPEHANYLRTRYERDRQSAYSFFFNFWNSWRTFFTWRLRNSVTPSLFFHCYKIAFCRCK